jgi:plastocyanin
MHRFVGFVLVVSLGLLLGCSSGLNRPVKEVTATVGTDNVQKVEITTHSFWFEPNRIVVHAGKPVELKVHNGSWMVPHNLTIAAPQADINVNASAGIPARSKTVTFTPSQEGEYTFFCHVDGHSKKGMTGTLVVVK